MKLFLHTSMVWWLLSPAAVCWLHERSIWNGLSSLLKKVLEDRSKEVLTSNIVVNVGWILPLSKHASPLAMDYNGMGWRSSLLLACQKLIVMQLPMTRWRVWTWSLNLSLPTLWFVHHWIFRKFQNLKSNVVVVLMLLINYCLVLPSCHFTHNCQ